MIEKIKRTDEEWRQTLTPEPSGICRNQGAEPLLT